MAEEVVQVAPTPQPTPQPVVPQPTPTPTPSMGVFEKFGKAIDGMFGWFGTKTGGVTSIGSGPATQRFVIIAILVTLLGGHLITSPIGCQIPSIPWPWPTPTPTPTPVPPPSPAPIPTEGLRVLIVYDSGNTTLPAAQQQILYGKTFRDHLNSKCVMGTDGKTHEWRLWDKDTDTTNEPKLWQDVMKRQHPQLPWLVISNGKTGYEGPLPSTVDAATTLIAKYEGK
jgi:hypothetical protein